MYITTPKPGRAHKLKSSIVFYMFLGLKHPMDEKQKGADFWTENCGRAPDPPPFPTAGTTQNWHCHCHVAPKTITHRMAMTYRDGTLM